MDDIDSARVHAMKEVERHLRQLAGDQKETRDDGQAQAQAQPQAQAADAGVAATQAQGRPLPIDWSTEGTPAYANGMQILHRASEFALVFTDMAAFPGRLSPDGRAGNERAAVVASLRITPDAFFQMLCVMTSNWNRYIGAVTDARMRQPRFKLLDAGELQLDGLPPSASAKE